jgi:glycosyltransferase involved in cell wall biosynthesis
MADRPSARGADARFTVVVPTINSAEWIAALHAYYQTIGVSPLYCVDRNSTDDTESVLSEIDARVALVSPEMPRVESMIEGFGRLVDTPWILRLDDDECPSAALIHWIRSRRCEFPDDVVAFARKWLRFTSPSRLEFAASARWDSASSKNGEDRQFRLYRHDRVTYVTDIHTPGFVVDSATYAPPDACLYHFDWILRSKEERRRKMARYDRQRAGAGSATAHYYIPEDVRSWARSGAITDEEVVLLAERMRTSRAHAH